MSELAPARPPILTKRRILFAIAAVELTLVFLDAWLILEDRR